MRASTADILGAEHERDSSVAAFQKTVGALVATYTYYVMSQPVLDATSADLGGLTRRDERMGRHACQCKPGHANLLAENRSDQVTRGNLRPEPA